MDVYGKCFFLPFFRSALENLLTQITKKIYIFVVNKNNGKIFIL